MLCAFILACFATTVGPKRLAENVRHELGCSAGFETGTKAAAAGGLTTLIDMPLNNQPPTTTAELVRQKLKAAQVPGPAS